MINGVLMCMRSGVVQALLDNSFLVSTSAKEHFIWRSRLTPFRCDGEPWAVSRLVGDPFLGDFLPAQIGLLVALCLSAVSPWCLPLAVALVVVTPTRRTLVRLVPTTNQRAHCLKLS